MLALYRHLSFSSNSFLSITYQICYLDSGFDTWIDILIIGNGNMNHLFGHSKNEGFSAQTSDFTCMAGYA